jgi:hypothetical protein
MSTESETKKLLHYRQFLENRIQELNNEIRDLNKSLEIIDQHIVTQGFKTPTIFRNRKEVNKPEQVEGPEGTSITAKDGTVLGRMYTDEENLSFKPRENFSFTTDLPPFNSFLIDRVFANMKTTDEERSSRGELDPNRILEYHVRTEGTMIKEIQIKNYGEERRLREINSSIRWTFDKMFEKIKES